MPICWDAHVSKAGTPKEHRPAVALTLHGPASAAEARGISGYMQWLECHVARVALHVGTCGNMWGYTCLPRAADQQRWVQEFYRVMQDALGMLTAFPLGEFADRYYQEAASSSVATAISLGMRPSCLLILVSICGA